MRFALIVFLVLSGVIARADLTYSSISGTPTNSVNYLSYEVGGYFLNQAGADVVITQLGRWKKSGNNQIHTLTAYNTNGTVAASTTVDMSGPEPAGNFVFGDLASDLTVPAGGAIYILSTETSGLDSWWAQQGITNSTPYGSIYIATRQSGVLSSQYPNGASQTFGPVTFKYSAPIANFSYNAGTHTYTFPGGADYFSVNAAMQEAVSGDIVDIGTGTNTWFIGGSKLTVKAGVTLTGTSAAASIINMSTSAVSGYSDASITLQEGSVLQNLTINGPNALNCVPIQTQTGAGTWVVSGVTYNQYSGRSSYFIKINGAPTGLITGCTINGAAGNSELIFSRGPNNAWQNPIGWGDANAVYIEGNTFAGSGYVNDANSNGKVVIRMNTITGQMKADGHGLASNGEPSSSNRGVRRMEIYGNAWTAGTGNWYAMELRGGGVMVFNNTAVTDDGGAAAIILRDYGYVGQSGGFKYILQTPQNYPLLDQVGRGSDETVNATEVSLGDYVQIASIGTTDFTDFGASANTVGLWFFATGTPTGTGTVVRNSAEPSYLFGNIREGIAWARSVPPVATGGSYTTNSAGYVVGSTTITFSSMNTTTYAGNSIAFANDTNRYLITVGNTFGSNKPMTIAAPGLLDDIAASAVAGTVNALTQWQRQQGSSSATFTDRDIIQSNRDFYASAGFDTNTGVTVGTAAQMALATPTLNYGFWVTDEGSWNTENDTPGTPGYQKGQGQLYVGNGATWDLAYTPYVYPYGEDPPPPTPIFSSAATNTDGDELSITFSISCTTGAGGNGGVTVTASGGAVTWTYASGSGSDTYTGNLNRVIEADETITVSYTQPGNGIESTDDQVDVDSFTNLPVANNSTAGETTTIDVTTLNADAIIIGL